MATSMVEGGSVAIMMPSLEQHASGVPMESQLKREDVGADSNGVLEKNGAEPGIESFPIVYKRRFAKGGASTDSKAPRPAPAVVRDECRSADQIGGKSLAFLQKKVSASGATQKQSTLEHFWKQPGTKPINGPPAQSSEVPELQHPVPLERNIIALEKSPSKRKRVAKSSDVALEGDAVVDTLGANAKKQTRKPKVVGIAEQNVDGGGLLPAGEVPSKKRRVGRPTKEGAKRTAERRVRPAKRPKLVLGANCKLEVEEDIVQPQLVALSESRQNIGLEVRGFPVARLGLRDEDRMSPAEPQVHEESSSETQTDDDLPTRLGHGQIRQPQKQQSSEATESETATETDPDLPHIKGERSAKQCEEEDDESDGERMPIDLNVLPELLMSAKPRRKKSAGAQSNGTQKPRRPALKRVEIHQQLQPLDQRRKAVQTNQIVKSLWPIPHHPDSLDVHAEEDVDPITSNSGKFVSLKHLKSPLPSRLHDTHSNGGDAGVSREVHRVSDPGSKDRRIRVVQPKMVRLSPGKGWKDPRLLNLAPALSFRSFGIGGANEMPVETRASSSSEETESDIEQKVGRSMVVASHPGVTSFSQSPGALSNGSSPRGKISGVLHLKNSEKPGTDIDLNRMGCKTIQRNVFVSSPGVRRAGITDPQRQWQESPRTYAQGKQGSRTPDSSDDSETESDEDIVGVGVNRARHSPQVQKVMPGGVHQQNGHRGQVSGVLKARVVGNSEGLTDRNSPICPPLSFHIRSIGSTPVKSLGTGLHNKDPGNTAPTIKRHPRGMFSRNVSRSAKFMRSPQARMVNRFQRKRDVSRFSPSHSRMGKKTEKFQINGAESASHGGRKHEGSTGVKNTLKVIPGSPHSALHTPLLRSPALDRRQGTVTAVTPKARQRIVNGDNGGIQETNCLSKMTPRTRKLTDAMQKFVTQKANRRQWREIDLSKVHPTALIGRTCKVFWPLDDDWYPGVIHDYNPQTKKHRIDYQDNEMEQVFVAKERIKLKLSPEEWVELETSTGEQLTRKWDLDELAIQAAGADDQIGQLGHGDLVWAKVKGYPMWPAFVMDEEHAKACGMEPAKKGMLPIQFFGSYDFSRFSSKKVVVFSKGLMAKFHNKCKRLAFEQGLEEVERYLKECRLPDSMAHLLDDSVGDGVHGAIERQRQEIEENWPEPDDQENRGDGRKRTIRKSSKRLFTFPMHLGALTVLTLGKVVRDSEHFHDQQYIWPEGYSAIRKFPSTRDPDICVDYRMQVLRNPCMKSLPMFRVTPEDESPIEGPSPYACWKKFFQKLRKGQLGKSTSPDQAQEKLRRQFRSGAHMFGFSHPRISKLIQGLPHARACTKFTNWSIKAPLEGSEAVLPAGYKPVDIAWKHLDRCTVCYLDEEYTDNLLLQCDKCRIMVHMNCYGELELPDGDLWLCNLCRPEAPKYRPPCCLCPVTNGALKKTTDGRWAHLMCAMWIPETCLVDVKRMEPVDGINAISKERWRLTCSVCKIPYGACIQCTVNNCRTAFHPLCARSAGLCMEVLEEKRKGDGETDVRLLAYCRKHRQPTSKTCEVIIPAQQAQTDCLSYEPPKNHSGCARSELYNAAARRGRREPEALAAALAKRLFVENLPHKVTGCRQNVPPSEMAPRNGGSLWSLHWEATKGGGAPGASLAALSALKSGEDAELVLSMSEKFRRMRSSLSQRLVFGKSAIHGMGVFTKLVHYANDMVIEYAGEVVRPVVADIRERRCYDSLVGAGTYMFRIDDERVVDATHAGSIAHLINHSCEPNCYSRTVTASGEDRIIIFAKRDIQLGEELTYDYRFMSKDELLTCYCGCTGCRGSVNVVDGDGDPTKLLLPLSDLIKLPSTTRGHTH